MSGFHFFSFFSVENAQILVRNMRGFCSEILVNGPLGYVHTVVFGCGMVADSASNFTPIAPFFSLPFF